MTVLNLLLLCGIVITDRPVPCVITEHNPVGVVVTDRVTSDHFSGGDQVDPDLSDDYVVMFTRKSCGPCVRWISSEKVRMERQVQIVVIDLDDRVNRKWAQKVSLTPSFWICDRKTRTVTRNLKFTGFTDADTLLSKMRVRTKTKVRTRIVEPKPIRTIRVRQWQRLPVVNTPWGTIDLETYHRNCNCPMCQGIRSMQQQYRSQTTEVVVPSEDVSEVNGATEERKVKLGCEPCPDEWIDQSLESLDLTPGDVFADVGCGDGRVLIAAAERYGCRGIGYEIDPETVAVARKRISDAGLTSQIRIIEGDAVDTFRPMEHGVTAVYGFLFEDLLSRLADRFSQVSRGVFPFHRPGGMTVVKRGDLWTWRKTRS